MRVSDREVRIDFRGNSAPFLAVVGAVLLSYGLWLWQAQPSLAPVLVTLPLLFLLRFLQRPLTLERALVIRPEQIVIASRLLMRRTRALSLDRLEELRELQIGTKTNSVWALELVLKGGSVQRLGELSPGFRPHLRRAQSLLRRSRA